MTTAVTIRVQETDFDPGAEIAAMSAGRRSIIPLKTARSSS